MKTETFQIEIITPCFCGGAEPDKQAEIRAPSIRGQLRWWLRTLGGFKSMAAQGLGVRQQEQLIFGSAAGDEGQAGKLIVRVKSSRLLSSVRDGQELGYRVFTEPAYLTFPVQSREKDGQKTQYAGRGVFLNGSFELIIIWRGGAEWWEDVRALVSVFGHLGALGFRGRRAMGALAFCGGKLPGLNEARSSFVSPKSVLIKQLPAQSSEHAISVLGGWLKSCRAHGRSGKNESETRSPFFSFAKVDHDIGYNLPGSQNKDAFRPALGLPIIQRIRDGTNKWEWDWNKEKSQPKGRFASPVMLRPHKDSQGKWHALVMFVDAHKWPDGKQVFLNGRPRNVSLDLYEKMKTDNRLNDFPS